MILTTTNKTRIHINQILNDHHSQYHNDILKLKCKYNNGPQDMKIWKGIILQSAVTTYSNKKGATENSIRLRNACRYVVNDIDDVAIYIQQIDDKGSIIDEKGQKYSETFPVKKDEVCTNLRLSYASTYDSIQSRTCYGHVKLCETEKSKFAVRKLIVGLVRVEVSAQISIE